MSMPSPFVLEAADCRAVIAAARGITGDMPPTEAYLLLFRAIGGFAHAARRKTAASVPACDAANAAIRFLNGDTSRDTARRDIGRAEHLLDRLALTDDENQAASPFGHSGWSARKTDTPVPT